MRESNPIATSPILLNELLELDVLLWRPRPLFHIGLVTTWSPPHLSLSLSLSHTHTHTHTKCRPRVQDPWGKKGHWLRGYNTNATQIAKQGGERGTKAVYMHICNNNKKEGDERHKYQWGAEKSKDSLSCFNQLSLPTLREDVAPVSQHSEHATNTYHQS